MHIRTGDDDDDLFGYIQGAWAGKTTRVAGLTCEASTWTLEGLRRSEAEAREPKAPVGKQVWLGRKRWLFGPRIGVKKKQESGVGKGQARRKLGCRFTGGGGERVTVLTSVEKREVPYRGRDEVPCRISCKARHVLVPDRGKEGRAR